jgi:DNA-binding response OmpR family regulator
MAKILVVDDEPDILQLLSFNLQQMKWQVLQASRGRQGLELAPIWNFDCWRFWPGMPA